MHAQEGKDATFPHRRGRESPGRRRGDRGPRIGPPASSTRRVPCWSNEDSIRAAERFGRRSSGNDAHFDAAQEAMAARPAESGAPARVGVLSLRSGRADWRSHPVCLLPPRRGQTSCRRSPAGDLGGRGIRSERTSGDWRETTTDRPGMDQGAGVTRLVGREVRQAGHARARICRRLGPADGRICMGQANQTLPTEDPTGTRAAGEVGQGRTKGYDRNRKDLAWQRATRNENPDG